MDKIPNFIVRLAVAIFLLTLSLWSSLSVLLAIMPDIQKLSHELTQIRWDGYQLLIHEILKVILLSLLIIFGVKLLFKKPKSNTPT